MDKMVKKIVFILILSLFVQFAFGEVTKYVSYDFESNTWVDLGIEAPENVVCTIEYQGKLVALIESNELLEYDSLTSSWGQMNIILPDNSIEIKPLYTETDDEILMVRTSLKRIHYFVNNEWIVLSLEVPDSTMQMVTDGYIGILTNDSNIYIYNVYENVLELEEDSFPIDLKSILIFKDGYIYVSSRNEIYEFDDYLNLNKKEIFIDDYFLDLFFFNNKITSRYSESQGSNL